MTAVILIIALSALGAAGVGFLLVVIAIRREDRHRVPLGAMTAPGRLFERAEESYWRQVADYYQSLPADRFPHTAAMVGDLMSGDPEERFEFGLGVLLDGLERHLP